MMDELTKAVSVEDFNRALHMDWSFEIICPDCDQIIVRNLYIRDFNSGKGVAVATQKVMAEHILKAHSEEIEESDDNDLDVPMD
jgi:hypothetical protein